MTNVLAHRGPDAAGFYHSKFAPHGTQANSPDRHSRVEPPAIEQTDMFGGFGSVAGTASPGGHRRETSAGETSAGDTSAGNTWAGNMSTGAAFGHRRLSIIDLTTGQQPLCNEDGSIWITFNGEIYNYRELGPDLQRRGHRFRTHGDTEVIVHLYEEYGLDCVQMLRGMFVFAIWDLPRQRLWLVRDRLGKKPLLLRREKHRVTFASELKGLLQVPGAPRHVSPTAIDDFLTYQYVPHPRCILDDYEKLPPASWGLWTATGSTTGSTTGPKTGEPGWQVHRYWRPGYERRAATNGTAAKVEIESAQDTENIGSYSNDHDALVTQAEQSQRLARALESPAAARRILRETLTTAVGLRMRSDVPLGAFLSGGIDSTIIAGLMQSQSNQPVNTFSIGFPVPEFDERSFARLAAERLQTRHHELVVDPSAAETLSRLIWHYDEPFADSSAIPCMYLSELTRQHVTVSLSGDGGDELFAGYDRYRAVEFGSRFDRLPHLLRRVLSAKIWQKLPGSIHQKSKIRRLKRLLEALGDEPRHRYLRWVSSFDSDRKSAIYSPEFATQLHGHTAADFLLHAYKECPNRDFLTQTTATDVLTYLPCDILNKVDIASMAFGLEVRCPFLDHQVVELAAAIPMEWKRNGGIGKKILLETFADLLPPEIQKRPKMGFGVPLANWFRGPLAELLRDTLLSRRAIERGYFSAAGIEQLITEHAAGSWDHSYRLWSLLVLEMWHACYLDTAAPPYDLPLFRNRVF